jgi:hypothetical protein
MRYRRAIEKIRILAETCEDLKRFRSEEPFLLIWTSSTPPNRLRTRR